MKGCGDQPGGFQQLQVLNDARTRDRQTARKLARGTRNTRKTLKDDHTNRMTE
jgi:hypothetical protein